MECRDAQFYLRLRRHAADELGPDVTADLDRHLAGCPQCAAEGHTLATFDVALAAAMQAVPVPQALHARLVADLVVRSGQTFRRKVYRGLAIAASLLLAVGLGIGAFSASRPRFDTTALVLATDSQLENPQEATRIWLADNGLPDRLPLPFDHNLTFSRGLDTVQGRNVPVIVFREPGKAGFAKVYFFRTNGQFDLKGVQDAQASYTRAVVIDDPRQFPGVVFVVVHTGESLAPFLKARGGDGV